ncbi:MAG: cytochrome-c peroxidase, partial [Pyrinomonadaceae bacterium]
THRAMSHRAIVRLRAFVILAFLLPVFVKANDSFFSSTGFEKLPRGIPFDLWSYYIPKDNLITAQKVELGRQIFFDKRLSADGSVSCATCHDPKLGFTDGKRVAEGIGGRLGARNSPTLLNSMFNSEQFWDGRAESLEAQARLPLINPDEMGNQTHDRVVERLKALSEYSTSFPQVFGSPVTIDLVSKAISAYERTLVSGNSALDRYLAGDLNALSIPARSGMALFRGKAHCSVCHTFNQSFPFLTDGNYHNTGVAVNFRAFDGLSRRAVQIARNQSHVSLDSLAKETGAFELGRFLVTGNSLDIGAYRTPSLRNVELTAPYFHDGSAATLLDVIEFYVKGGSANPFRDWQLEPVSLTESEQRDLVE